ncbi:KpsF/GutQ family sugar-phosphate isomerase [Terasakiella sp. A23]|uniref:KpsF/GutQ family sugar-phosphate isomerase n=1 Tax=Terasakiella sp. FCG-A23 TaxID=3080561 RepID=UPI002954BD6B|nr:KpsF/GutQ family sugar-phosphate isomerase [Terasakiella sp. A23]MDV7341633.1 KpsF/GutQ family sugar-phosphate isomerase [Terasakiella sp. A23]
MPVKTKTNEKKSSTIDLNRAKQVLAVETNALQSLSKSLNVSFVKAVDALSNTRGRIVVTGMGKSGHIGRKIAATLASTGSPAFFIHPGEASHGDLGMATQADTILAISNSGETSELSDFIAYSRRFTIPLIAITSRPQSTLGEAADITLTLPAVKEACPFNLAPTTSTTMTLALGDCIAVTLLKRKNFSSDDFKNFHPGGSLGNQLLKVEDLMHKGNSLPFVTQQTKMSETLLKMTSKSFGCVAVTDIDLNLLGVITDGDLRRNMNDELLKKDAGAIMTPNAQTIAPHALAAEALALMNEKTITSLFVTNGDKKVLGILHIHDCLRAGIV